MEYVHSGLKEILLCCNAEVPNHQRCDGRRKKRLHGGTLYKKGVLTEKRSDTFSVPQKRIWVRAGAYEGIHLEFISKTLKNFL